MSQASCVCCSPGALYINHVLSTAARAIAGEAGVPFFYTSGSEFEEVGPKEVLRRSSELV
jgi:hypothetical protein